MKLRTLVSWIGEDSTDGRMSVGPTADSDTRPGAVPKVCVDLLR
jgi:hypothetical protein